jgi:ribonuclease-3
MKDQIFHEFESVISYTFSDIKLLIQALIHSSYANENNLKKIENNERLEFLGDAVLEIVTSDYLFHKYPNQQEGELTKFRASVVCEPTLAEFAREIKLGNYLLLGKGEDSSGGRNRDSVLSDSVEALIGSIYIDGGIESATSFIVNTLLFDVEERKRFVDSKTHLQEYIQQMSDIPIEYTVISETGPDHNKCFTVHVIHESNIIGKGEGRSKKSAEQRAAFDALKKINSK